MYFFSYIRSRSISANWVWYRGCVLVRGGEDNIYQRSESDAWGKVPEKEVSNSPRKSWTGFKTWHWFLHSTGKLGITCSNYKRHANLSVRICFVRISRLKFANFLEYFKNKPRLRFWTDFIFFLTWFLLTQYHYMCLKQPPPLFLQRKKQPEPDGNCLPNKLCAWLKCLHITEGCLVCSLFYPAGNGSVFTCSGIGCTEESITAALSIKRKTKLLGVQLFSS